MHNTIPSHLRAFPFTRCVGNASPSVATLATFICPEANPRGIKISSMREGQVDHTSIDPTCPSHLETSFPRKIKLSKDTAWDSPVTELAPRNFKVVSMRFTCHLQPEATFTQVLITRIVEEFLQLGDHKARSSQRRQSETTIRIKGKPTNTTLRRRRWQRCMHGATRGKISLFVYILATPTRQENTLHISTSSEYRFSTIFCVVMSNGFAVLSRQWRVSIQVKHPTQ